MNEEYMINRADYLLLSTLYAAGCTDYYTSMTIAEIIEDNTDENGNHPLGSKMTIYRKLQKLVKNGYIDKGIRDDHADTYYVQEKTIKLMESRGKEV